MAGEGVKGGPGVPPRVAAVSPFSSSSMSMMSLSPTTSTSNYDDQPNGKRRRTTSFNTSPALNGSRSEMASPQDSPAHAPPSSVPSAHIPKRGARACTACRKGKNRCEGEVCYILLWTLDGTLTPSLPWPATPPGPVQNRLLVVAVN